MQLNSSIKLWELQGRNIQAGLTFFFILIFTGYETAWSPEPNLDILEKITNFAPAGN
jgi:hypothetical protein